MRPKMVKFCGITQSADAQYCIDHGADALGFIFHSASPRNLSHRRFRELSKEIDFKKCLKVAVAVAPDPNLVGDLISLGFEKFQFHFPMDLPLQEIKRWSELVGVENLWLAPRMKPTDELPADFLREAKTFLVDTYSREAFGGTGQTSDWARFVKLKKQFTQHSWILAGGLSPDNLGDALLANEPDGIDVNSGVESAPGIKNTDQIDQVFTVLKKFQAGN